MSGRDYRSALLGVLARPLAAIGLDLEDVEVTAAGRRRVVRVLVDKDGGVSLDDVAGAATDVSAVLDSSDLLGDGSYTLEVTSPGVDRPLTLPRHWRRNVDRLVKVTRTSGETVTGRVIEAGDASATLDVDGARTEQPYSDVATARVEVEFSRPASRAGKRSAGHLSTRHEDDREE